MARSVSRFIKKTLLPDETVVREARFHGFYTFSACFFLVACAIGGWGFHYAVYRFLGYWEVMPAFIGLGLGLWVLFWMMLKKWTTEIVLTDMRLLYKRGFFLVNVDEVDIEQLASDYVQQSLLGRLLDYGTLHIRCIEASDIWLPDIARPYQFRNAIEQEKRKYRDHYMNTGRIRKRAAGKDD